MNVLLIAYHFPPDPAVGSRRPANLVRTLLARGHHVHVLSAPFAEEPAVHAEGRLTVERVRPMFDARAAWARLRERMQSHAHRQSRGEPTPAPWRRPEHTSFWKRQILAALWLPDDRQGWLLAAIRRGRRLLSASSHLVYTTAPPYSAHLAGLALSRRPGQVWVAEFRDPWTDNPVKEHFVRTSWSDAIERRLELSCMTAATRIVATTEAAASVFRTKAGVRADDVVASRNGIGRSELTPAMPGPGNGRIIYFGNLYHARDPRPFLQAYSHLHSSGALPANAAIDFVGNCDSYQGRLLQDTACELGIAERVAFHGRVPRDEGLSMLRRASALLLLAQRQPLQVPQKLYDYLATGRPILAFADEDGETALMLREIGGHYLLSESDFASTADAITQVLARPYRPAQGVAEIPSDWITEHVFDALVQLLESLCGTTMRSTVTSRPPPHLPGRRPLVPSAIPVMHEQLRLPPGATRSF